MRYAIVVMGMHRSGTSALAGVLARLGCDAPIDLMDATPMNSKGFYESSTITSMNEELLKSAGSAWFSWQELNQDWFGSPEAADFKDRALENLKEVYGNSRLPLLKDPRMCILVPFWENVFAEAGYVPKYLHTHRHPLEVAQSLKHWAGYDPAYGEVLWLRYVLEAEAATRGKSRAFTSYNQTMQDWSAVGQRAAGTLDLTWSELSDHAAVEINDFLDDGLRHMEVIRSYSDSKQRMGPWVAQVYNIMERWVETGENANDWATLDSLHEQFNKAAPTFSALVETGRKDALALQVKKREEKQTAAALQQLRSSKDEAKKASVQLKVSLDLAREQARALANTNAALEKQLAARAAETVQLEAERERFSHYLRNENVRREQDMQDQLTKALRNSYARIDTIRTDAEAEIARLRHEREQTLQQLREAEEHVKALLDSRSWRVTDPLRRLILVWRRIRS